jgi:hypothetical protein
MLTLSPNQAKRAIEACVRLKLPLMLHGPVGVGKSDAVRQAAEMLGFDVLDVRGSTIDPVDVRGLPVVSAPGGDGRVHFQPTALFPAAGCRPTIVFLDELTRAPMMVQNALLELILDRRIGEYVLPDNCVCVAAGNSESDGGGTQRMNSALANRFVHVRVAADLADWAFWACGGVAAAPAPTAPFQFAPAPGPALEPIVVAFAQFRPELLHKFDRAAEAFPTPRSWSFVSRIVSLGLDQATERALVTGCVGEGAADEFFVFQATWRRCPSIDGILLDPAGAPVPEDVGLQYAVASALATRSTVDNWERVLAYLKRMPSDFNVFAVRSAVARLPVLKSTLAFTQWAALHPQAL